MKKYQENLLDSKKRRTFAAQKSKDRDLAQLVAHTSGGREVAGSSPVIPTKKKTQITVNQWFGFLLFPKRSTKQALHKKRHIPSNQIKTAFYFGYMKYYHYLCRRN